MYGWWCIERYRSATDLCLVLQLAATCSDGIYLRLVLLAITRWATSALSNNAAAIAVLNSLTTLRPENASSTIYTSENLFGQRWELTAEPTKSKISELFKQLWLVYVQPSALLTNIKHARHTLIVCVNVCAHVFLTSNRTTQCLHVCSDLSNTTDVCAAMEAAFIAALAPGGPQTEAYQFVMQRLSIVRDLMQRPAAAATGVALVVPNQSVVLPHLL
jgi:hypothetical protein